MDVLVDGEWWCTLGEESDDDVKIIDEDVKITHEDKKKVSTGSDYKGDDDSPMSAKEMESHHKQVKESDEFDVDDFEDGYAMSEKERELYQRQVKESDGFDVDNFRDTVNYGMIVPINLDHSTDDAKDMADFAKLAIGEYNAEKDQNFKFVKLIKGNGQPVAGLMYYITFEVENGNDSTTTVFQAQVYDGINEVLVMMCRPKPPNH